MMQLLHGGFPLLRRQSEHQTGRDQPDTPGDEKAEPETTQPQIVNEQTGQNRRDPVGAGYSENPEAGIGHPPSLRASRPGSF